MDLSDFWPPTNLVNSFTSDFRRRMSCGIEWKITQLPRNKTDGKPRIELSELDKGGHGGYTLALAPLFFAAIGFLADRWLGWTPILTIIGAVYGLAGGVYKVVTEYRVRMAEQDRTPSWADGVGATSKQIKIDGAA